MFMDRALFAEEFFGHDERVVSLYRDFGTALDKAFATTKADNPSIAFKYWRKLSSKATKMRPLELRAELFMNPTYGTVWCLVTRA